jgi:hypothetical protein
MSDVSKLNTAFIIRGSVVKVRRTCGKAQCKCVDGALHETWALSYSYQGRTRMIPLREEDIGVARQAIERYRMALNRLESQAIQGIKRLHATVKAAKRRKR